MLIDLPQDKNNFEKKKTNNKFIEIYNNHHFIVRTQPMKL